MTPPELENPKRLHPPQGSPAAEQWAFGARRFVLAAALDGAALGGPEADRRALCRWLDATRPRIGLILVTGREPAFLETLCRETEIPWPDYVVGDMGASLSEIRFDDPDPAQGRVRPMAPLEKPLAEAWNDAAPRVREALDGHPGLTLQPGRPRRRVAYDLDPAAFDPVALPALDEMGLDHAVTGDGVLHVLPRGASKGASLRRLLAHLGVAENKCLAAGDRLDDLSMLEMDWPAVAVGGCEPALLQRLQPRATLHRARAVGAGGILEAIATLGLHPAPPRPGSG